MNLLNEYGYCTYGGENAPKASLLPARVTAVYRERYEIVSETGFCFARLKGALHHDPQAIFPTVGDYVWIQPQNGDAQIVLTMPRRTYFERLDPSGRGMRAQALAANFDTVFILTSLNEEFNPRRLERYLALARQSGAQPVIVLTKSDLAADAHDYVLRLSERDRQTPVFSVSAKNAQGLTQLDPYLKSGGTVVLLGSSGVGKSSLINAWMGESFMRTGAIRQDDSRGRHTTTHRQMLRLPGGALVIDTPGMRELGLWDNRDGLMQEFSDITAFAAQCRFRDCTHQGEPGCAVQFAIQNGVLNEQRVKHYLKLLKEHKTPPKKAREKRFKS